MNKKQFLARLERMRTYPLTYDQLDESLDVVSRWLLDCIEVIEKKDKLISRVCEVDHDWFEIAHTALDLKPDFLKSDEKAKRQKI